MHLPGLTAAILLAVISASVPAGCTEETNSLLACQQEGQPYFLADIAGSEGGLNNQRWVILMYLAVADRNNLTFWPGPLFMELFGECSESVGTIPFSRVYSVEALTQFCRERGIQVVLDVPAELKEQCCATHSAVTATEKGIKDIVGWVAKPQKAEEAVCLTFLQGFWQLPEAFPELAVAPYTDPLRKAQFFFYNPEWQVYRPALQPSGAVKRVVELVLQLLASQYPEHVPEKEPDKSYVSGRRQRIRGSSSGQDGEQHVRFAALHVRNEWDFEHLCNQNAGAGGIRCFYTDTEAEALLRTKYKLEPGSLLQVMGGTELYEIPSICSTYTCFKASDLWEAAWDELPRELSTDIFGPCLTRDLRAMVNYWVASNARSFYGHAMSSYSSELASDFLRQRKPAYFYNEKCKVDDECT